MKTSPPSDCDQPWAPPRRTQKEAGTCWSPSGQRLSLAAVGIAEHLAGDDEIHRSLHSSRARTGCWPTAPGTEVARFVADKGVEPDLIEQGQRAGALRVLDQFPVGLDDLVVRAGRMIAVAVVNLRDGVAIAQQVGGLGRQREAVVTEEAVVGRAVVVELDRKSRVARDAGAGAGVIKAVAPDGQPGVRVACVAAEALVVAGDVAMKKVLGVGEGERRIAVLAGCLQPPVAAGCPRRPASWRWSGNARRRQPGRSRCRRWRLQGSPAWCMPGHRPSVRSSRGETRHRGSSWKGPPLRKCARKPARGCLPQ